MSSDLSKLYYEDKQPFKLIKWKVKPGTKIDRGNFILSCEYDNDGRVSIKSFKSTKDGNVEELIAKEGDTIKKGDALLVLKAGCSHQTFIRDMCAECGADLKTNRSQHISKSVSMLHSIPELRVNKQVAEKISKEDNNRLIYTKKLALLVDLDQTLIHTTNEQVQAEIKDVFHFQLYGPNSVWYHTRMRPHTAEFLEKMSKIFELHICTFGARHYAHTVANSLDPSKKYFSHRILSRDECFDSSSKTANLKDLFPSGDSMVCIIDDREDVWNYSKNLVPVKPYVFFGSTGDINAPPTAENKGSSQRTFKKRRLSDSGAGSSRASKKVRFVDNAQSFENPNTDSNNSSEDLELKTHNNQFKNKSEETTKIATSNLEIPTHSKTDDNKLTVDSQSFQENEDSDKEAKIVDKSSPTHAKESENNNFSGDSSDIVKPDTKIESESKVEEASSGNPSKSVNSITIENSKKLEQSELSSVMKNHKDEIDQELPSPVVNSKVDAEADISQPPSQQSEETVEKANTLENSKETIKEEGNTKLNSSGDENKDKRPLTERPSHLIDYNKKEDTDDYLLYLEDILTKIHEAYYEEYATLVSSNKKEVIPDLKEIIPKLRKQVLKDVVIVFSGVIPTNFPPERSKIWYLAKCLGAEMNSEITDATTHLIASKWGTVKVNKASISKKIHIVTPHWLIECGERWEKMEESLFLFQKNTIYIPNKMYGNLPEEFYRKNRALFESSSKQLLQELAPKGDFLSNINPLHFFSKTELNAMDEEVRDLVSDESDTSSDEDDKFEMPNETEALNKMILGSDISINSSEDEDSLTSDECPRGWKKSQDVFEEKDFYNSASESEEDI